MMSKKIYNDFARLIRKQRHDVARNIEVADEGNEFYMGAEKQISIIVDAMSDLFQNDNPKFDKDEFYFACEIEK